MPKCRQFLLSNTTYPPPLFFWIGADFSDHDFSVLSVTLYLDEFDVAYIIMLPVFHIHQCLSFSGSYLAFFTSCSETAVPPKGGLS